MKTLVIYDSGFGNTEKIAKAVAGTLKADIRSVLGVDHTKLSDFNFLIFGSPTRGGRPTQAMQEYLEKIEEVSLKDTKIATFDTRFGQEGLGLGLKVIVNIFGFAAPKIAKVLTDKGGKVISQEGFVVIKKEGPLLEGELERAREWARKLIKEPEWI